MRYMIKDKKPFSVRNRLKSFRYSFQGISILWKEEHNMRIHLVATFVVVIVGLSFRITQTEWLVITLTIALVLCAEAFNSAIERLCNEVNPEKNKKIAAIKDISAAAVLLTAIAAVIVAAIIFIPHFVKLF